MSSHLSPFLRLKPKRKHLVCSLCLRDINFRQKFNMTYELFSLPFMYVSILCLRRLLHLSRCHSMWLMIAGITSWNVNLNLTRLQKNYPGQMWNFLDWKKNQWNQQLGACESFFYSLFVFFSAHEIICSSKYQTLNILNRLFWWFFEFKLNWRNFLRNFWVFFYLNFWNLMLISC